jgi:hypothetical protein
MPPTHPAFLRLGYGLLETTEVTEAPHGVLGRIKRLLIGAPIPTALAEHERLTKFKAKEMTRWPWQGVGEPLSPVSGEAVLNSIARCRTARGHAQLVVDGADMGMDGAGTEYQLFGDLEVG